ncbi:hypothetical protein CRD36_06580 [Paremcibacter congregatus]|uniref:Uncharacterized protein n=1 Tax=Paremcibacter congregatus TaxID=2043170 RepID=A0A2G4YT25_9PROT|nr:hypothetical protein CRD36_06580 [Paremcibacter congregatus]
MRGVLRNDQIDRQFGHFIKKISHIYLSSNYGEKYSQSVFLLFCLRSSSLFVENNRQVLIPLFFTPCFLIKVDYGNIGTSHGKGMSR